MLIPAFSSRGYNYHEFVFTSIAGGGATGTFRLSNTAYNFQYPAAGFLSTALFTSGPNAWGTGGDYYIPAIDGETYTDCTWSTTGAFGAGSFINVTEYGWYVQPPGNLQAGSNVVTDLNASLLQQISTAVNLIQRQSVPFAYIFGELDSGLTGDGEIGVQGLLGAIVEITTFPAGAASTTDDPAFYFNVGWIAFGTSDGWVRDMRIVHNPQLILPSAGGVFTRIGYSLKPGYTINVQQIVREP